MNGQQASYVSTLIGSFSTSFQEDMKNSSSINFWGVRLGAIHRVLAIPLITALTQTLLLGSPRRSHNLAIFTIYRKEAYE